MLIVFLFVDIPNQRAAEVFLLLLLVSWLFADNMQFSQLHVSFCTSITSKILLHTILWSIKLTGIEENLREIQKNCKPFDQSSSLKLIKHYEGNTSILWNEFKQFFDAERKDISMSRMYRKVKSEIEDLGTGTIGASFTIQDENFEVDSVMGRK